MDDTAERRERPFESFEVPVEVGDRRRSDLPAALP
jgi:hypothetical protein